MRKLGREGVRLRFCYEKAGPCGYGIQRPIFALLLPDPVPDPVLFTVLSCPFYGVTPYCG